MIGSDRKDVLAVDKNEKSPSDVRQIIKDPMVLEFLDLKRESSYYEKDIETIMITKLKKIILIYCFFHIQIGFAQLKTYSMEEIERLKVQNPKPIMVFIHTNWCKYCELMAQTTFKNQAVIDQLNNDFYFVSLNAESKEAITYNQHTFVYKSTGTSTGIHELATELATINGQVSYPSIAILDAKDNIVYQKNSFFNAKYFLEIIKTSLAVSF